MATCGSESNDAGLEVRKEDCLYCPLAHYPLDHCPELRAKLVVVKHQEDLSFMEFNSQLHKELLNISVSDTEVWDKFHAGKQNDFRNLQKFYLDQEKFVRESLKTTALFKRSVMADVINSLGEDDDETQTCVYCPEFHVSKDCPIFLKTRDELLRRRWEKIFTWENEMQAEAALIQDENPGTWGKFKHKFYGRFAAMYIMQRAEETQVIKNLSIEASLLRRFLVEEKSSDEGEL